MRATASTLFVRDGSRRTTAGFTIVELAVTTVVIAILLGSILVPLNTQVESRKYDETNRVLERARDALLGFAAANGRFPCPASASSNGAEHFATFPTAGTPTNGICNPLTALATDVYSGFLPAVTLGFTPVDANGYAVDSWPRADVGGVPQNRIRYAVSRTQLHNGTIAVSNPFTKTNGMRSVTMPRIAGPENPLGTSVYLLHVCNTASASTTDCNSAAERLARNVIVVIWSLGPNAFKGGASPDELENLDNDRIVVSRTKSEGTSGEFDDLVTWIGAPTLFNRMVAAGQLP